MIKNVIFKKIKFTNFNQKKFNKIINKKGNFVFPAAPALVEIEKSKYYYKSLQEADFVFFDSGLFVIMLKIFRNISVNKFSGFKFLNLFFLYLKKNNKKKILSIDPNKIISIENKKYFEKKGIIKFYSYIAPIYKSKKITDKKLLKLVNKVRPNFIIINIGGTKQEILAHYMKQNLKNKQTILCTGAALSFLTGIQAPINKFYDKIYLGWFVRIIYNPKIFLKRYLCALSFVPIFFKNKIIIE